MAKSVGEAMDALTDAIFNLAEEAGKPNNKQSTACLNLATAAKELAEARAWLSRSDQPH